MQRRVAVGFAIGLAVSACAPYPVQQSAVPSPPQQPAAPVPLVVDPRQREECAVIRSELAREQRIAQTSGVMATPLVQATTLLNVNIVISSLQERAAIEGCPI